MMTLFCITDKTISEYTSTESQGINSVTKGSSRWEINYISFSKIVQNWIFTEKFPHELRIHIHK